MASMVAAAASGTSFLKPTTTPFLGQGRSDVNPIRDAIPMGSGKYTMVLSRRTLRFPIDMLWVALVSIYGSLSFLVRGMNCGTGQTE